MIVHEIATMSASSALAMVGIATVKLRPANPVMNCPSIALARRSRSVRGIIAVATLDPVGLDALQDVARPDEPGVHSQHAEQLDRRRELGARPRMIADVAPHHAALDAHACQQGTHLELFCDRRRLRISL